ncbi:MAG: rRNA pseudouridine synthase [Gemmatimonadaceae bacterium]|nr:rRNA pseudouridine synthase [Gemmatimonadaceae bacterium]
MRLIKYLANLGYGSRRDVTALFAAKRVRDTDGRVLRPDDSCAHESLTVDGEPLDPPPGVVVCLHKPLGYVCSTTDVANPVVYALLPERFRARSPIVAPVGRLDRDTSGLLLLTDDGQLNHRLTSPRSHVTKTYIATVADPFRGDEIAQFGAGTLTLASDPTPLAPARMEPIDAHRAQLELDEGRYHQIRRMFAAVGHHVTQLERVAIGALHLGDLPVGQWRVLTPDERTLLTASPPAAP